MGFNNSGDEYVQSINEWPALGALNLVLVWTAFGRD